MGPIGTGPEKRSGLPPTLVRSPWTLNEGTCAPRPPLHSPSLFLPHPSAGQPKPKPKPKPLLGFSEAWLHQALWSSASCWGEPPEPYTSAPQPPQTEPLAGLIPGPSTVTWLPSGTPPPLHQRFRSPLHLGVHLLLKGPAHSSPAPNRNKGVICRATSEDRNDKGSQASGHRLDTARVRRGAELGLFWVLPEPGH